jgi:6-phosphogluconolactonase/glucosamine-6-phosphate isomerase/deaminase
VPDERKAPAVKMAVTAPIESRYPCAYLRTHDDCYLMVDMPAAADILPKAK